IPLLPVILDFGDRARVRLGRVGAEFALRLPLPKQVPALVELLLEPLAAFGRMIGPGGQRVLLGHQLRDSGEQVVVGHVTASCERDRSVERTGCRTCGAVERTRVLTYEALAAVYYPDLAGDMPRGDLGQHDLRDIGWCGSA